MFRSAHRHHPRCRRHPHRQHRPCGRSTRGAWLALVAVLTLALMPTFARALAFVQGDRSGYAAVCTPQGMQWVASDGQRVPAAPTALPSPLDHCAFCPLSAAGAAPLPAATPVLALPLGSAQTPRTFLHAAHTPHVWRSAHPRGPPPSRLIPHA